MSLALAASPVLMTAASADYSANSGSVAERAVNDLSNRLGISKEAAAGVVGNFAAETGNFKHYQEIKPLVNGSRGGAGWAQWTAGRRVDFENYSASRGLATNSYEANLEFAVHELTGSHASVLAKLRNTTDPAEAAYIVRRYYEAPHGSGEGEHPSDAKRMGYAEAYANGDFSGSPTNGAYAGQGGYAYSGFGSGAGENFTQPAVSLMPWGSTRSIGAYPQGTT